MGKALDSRQEPGARRRKAEAAGRERAREIRAEFGGPRVQICRCGRKWHIVDPRTGPTHGMVFCLKLVTVTAIRTCAFLAEANRVIEATDRRSNWCSKCFDAAKAAGVI